MKRIVDALRAECYEVALQEDVQDNIVVCAMRANGERYKLGHISSFLAATQPEAALALISRMKYGKRNENRIQYIGDER